MQIVITTTVKDMAELADIVSTIDENKKNLQEQLVWVGKMHEKIEAILGEHAHLVYAPEGEAA